MRDLRVWGALFVMLADAPLGAQQLTTCDSVRLRDVRGETEDTLRVILRRANGNERLDPRFAIDALDALRRHFTLPQRIALPFRVPVNDSQSTLGLEVSVDFLAFRDGSVRQVHLSRSSYVPALDSAVLHAVRASGAEYAFAPFDSGMTGPSESLTVEVAFGLEDSIRAGIDAALMRRPRHHAMRLPQIIEPQRLPRFGSARAAGSMLGFVDMSFAVSESGRVLPGTVEFTRVTTRTLARAVLDVLPSWRFAPATIAGCAVPALVSQSFSFVFPP
ncbi:MAG: TonB C-terminal domain-containing protein [Gemmatimonadaceae bacterium]|nr:TonB C-terminal domain-containing protein [Gemmatimonadaceae bacterium]